MLSGDGQIRAVVPSTHIVTCLPPIAGWPDPCCGVKHTFRVGQHRI